MDDIFLSKEEKKSIFTKKPKGRKSISIAPNFKCPLADLLQAVGNGTNNNIINININTNQQPTVKIVKNKNRNSDFNTHLNSIAETENETKQPSTKVEKKIPNEKINKKEEIKSPIIQEKKPRKENPNQFFSQKNLEKKIVLLLENVEKKNKKKIIIIQLIKKIILKQIIIIKIFFIVQQKVIKSVISLLVYKILQKMKLIVLKQLQVE